MPEIWFWIVLVWACIATLCAVVSYVNLLESRKSASDWRSAWSDACDKTRDTQRALDNVSAKLNSVQAVLVDLRK